MNTTTAAKASKASKVSKEEKRPESVTKPYTYFKKKVGYPAWSTSELNPKSTTFIKEQYLAKVQELQKEKAIDEKKEKQAVMNAFIADLWVRSPFYNSKCLGHDASQLQAELRVDLLQRQAAWDAKHAAAPVARASPAAGHGAELEAYVASNATTVSSNATTVAIESNPASPESIVEDQYRESPRAKKMEYLRTEIEALRAHNQQLIDDAPGAQDGPEAEPAAENELKGQIEFLESEVENLEAEVEKRDDKIDRLKLWKDSLESDANMKDNMAFVNEVALNVLGIGMKAVTDDDQEILFLMKQFNDELKKKK